MAIKYALYKNNLKKGSGRYTARVLKNSSADLDTIADYIVTRGTYLQKPAIIAVLSTLITVAERLLAQGTKIKLDGLVEMVPKIQGKFSGCRDKFDPARHKLNINVNTLRKAKKHFRYYAELSKTETVLPQPYPCRFLDNATGRENETITPNRLGILRGFKMSFDPNKTEEGIFVIDTTTQQETRIYNLAQNKPSQLIFYVPDFEYNCVYIEVRKRFTKNGTLRENRLPHILHNTKSKFSIVPAKTINNHSLIENRKAASENTFQNYTVTNNEQHTMSLTTKNLQTSVL